MKVRTLLLITLRAWTHVPTATPTLNFPSTRRGSLSVLCACVVSVHTEFPRSREAGSKQPVFYVRKPTLALKSSDRPKLPEGWKLQTRQLIAQPFHPRGVSKVLGNGIWIACLRMPTSRSYNVHYSPSLYSSRLNGCTLRTTAWLHYQMEFPKATKLHS